MRVLVLCFRVSGLIVSFLGRLVAGNRLTVPVEIRWRFRLEPGRVYHVRLRFADLGSGEFYARLQRGGQITVPVEVVEGEGLSRGDLVKVSIQVGDEG
jgi:bifunctional DNA-binding transcriptional regulator/antitoxin component of YhaV-PrlF toxin-antitoxin module